MTEPTPLEAEIRRRISLAGPMPARSRNDGECSAPADRITSPACSVIDAPPAAQCVSVDESWLTVGLMPFVPFWFQLICVSRAVQRPIGDDAPSDGSMSRIVPTLFNMHAV